MPNVGSYEFKGNDGSSWKDPVYVQGHDGSAWKYGIAVYFHDGTNWVEGWNARPVAVSSSMATTGTGLTFSGTADPNNFSTTAKFEYKEVGGSYSNSGTTTTGMGDGVDGAVSFTVTATVADTYKNWEARASATNTAGTGTGSTLTLDCRKHNAGGSGWGTSTTSVTDPDGNCGGCGTRSRTDTTYTKTGCQSYTVTGSYGACSDSWQSLPAFTSGCFPLTNGTYAYAASSLWGYIYYTDSGCSNAIASCPSGGLAGPVDIEYCSTSGLYRVAGGDTCVYPSCC